MHYQYDAQGTRVVSSRSYGGSNYTNTFMYGAAGNLLWETASSGEVKEYIYVDGKQVALRRARP